ncbi:MAG: hypothetical protein ACE5E1_08640 [Phycisphaerae bacterium]
MMASKRNWNWKRAILLAAVSAGLGVAAGLYTLLRTPGWYAPPTVRADDRQRVRDDLVRAEQAFTEGLRAGRPFVYHIYDDVSNRWIAMRKEIYPLVDEIAPPLLADPFLLIGDRVITIAGRYRLLGVGVVLSIDLEPTFRDGAIELRANRVRCGSLPLPKDTTGLGLGRALRFEAGDLWPGSPEMSGNFLTGFRVGGEAWWKNGGVAYRVTGLSVRPGEISLDIQPLGRRAGRKRNRHSAPG